MRPHGLPLFAGNTDQGFGGGAIFAITASKPEVHPYVWQVTGYALGLWTSEHGSGPNYQDYYVDFTVPEALAPHRIRVELRPEYVNETLFFYGLGNASPYTPIWEAFPTKSDAWRHARDIFQYRRKQATTRFRTRMKLTEHWFAELTHALTWNEVTATPDSLVAQGESSTDPSTKLYGLGKSWSYVFENTIAYDTRDHEVDPTRGVWLAVGPRFAPGGTDPFPFQYGGLNANLRFYHAFTSDLTLAFRIVGDALFGPNVPLYELSRWTEGQAIGGSTGMRGVPLGRYNGKIKIFENLELRSWLLRFRLLGDSARIGVTALFDAGRVWADWHSQPELDGTGLGLKYGVGGGVRFGWGEGFVVRFDVAYSPDAHPISAYFDAYHTF